ncbi:MAG TPA: biotin--[acetyl-CoA-carboxylase] ligase [Actinomycetota bacterium]|nr:biotin--[acetyl-CoA-carboxylase] ligase [Actinomycetota bacterium]
MTAGGRPRRGGGVIDARGVDEAARAAGFGGVARYVTATGSTNDDLIAAADAGAPAWSVLVAGRQDAGRGRRGRTWIAGQGSSLLVSVLLRPAAPPDLAALVSLGAAVAVCEALGEAGVRARCTWPNDVIAEGSGRKIAGVLPESRIEGGALRHVVIGAGVNVRQRRHDFPQELRSSATSVVLEGGSTDQRALLGSYLAALRAGSDPDAPGFAGRALDAYRARSDTIGREVRAIMSDGRTIVGKAVDVDNGGRLVIRPSRGEEVVVSSGEVERIR